VANDHTREGRIPKSLEENFKKRSGIELEAFSAPGPALRAAQALFK
jgi:hypothetical protein